MTRRARRASAQRAPRGVPEAPLTLIHRNKGPNPVSMRVSGRFGSVEEACREAVDAALAGDFDPGRVQVYSDPIPALMWASATLGGRGILLAVVPVPDEIRGALGVRESSEDGAWAVGLPSVLWGLFADLRELVEGGGAGGADDLAPH